MREALLKKRLGIPAALLILLVSAGVATACVVATFAYKITTHEPLSFTEINGLNIQFQGESDDIVIMASNVSTKQGYGIFVDVSVVDSHVDSISYSTTNLVSTEQEAGNMNGDSDELDARYNIAAGATYDIVVTVDSADDVSAGELSVTLDFLREAKY